MRVERLATPRPEFLSPMLWRRENPSHLQPDHLRVGRSFVCRVVLADHLAARVCAPAALGTCHRELAGSRRRRHDKSHHGNRLATATVAGEAAQLPTSSRGTSCHRTQRARYPTPRIGHPLSAKEAERTLRSGLQVTWTICGQTCRSGGAICHSVGQAAPNAALCRELLRGACRVYARGAPDHTAIGRQVGHSSPLQAQNRRHLASVAYSEVARHGR